MSDNTIDVVPESPLNSIYGENPLLSPLGPRIAFNSLASKLDNQTLAGYDLGGFDATSREELLLLQKQNFVPTAASIDIAAALQNLHREYYWQRHPRNPAVLRDRTKIAQFIRSKDFDPRSVPWLNTSASGMIIKGITGTGKSAATTRYTRILKEQVHEHEEGKILGFDYVRQIAWLSVEMSSDGSRDGFLTSILLEIDRLIDTTYAKQFSGRYSVDRLAIVVGVILSTHLCGLLIIEEIQEKNFNNSKWRSPLTTFFLRILNFGIPIVLIGNPLGFTELEKSSQNVRRLSSGGVFEMLPYLEKEDLDLRNLVDKTLLFNVMESQNPKASDYFRQIAYAYTGGIIDFIVRLNADSQKIALHCGDTEVLPRHIDAAFSSPQLSPNHNLINGLAKKSPDTLRKVNDVPVDRFVEIWIEYKTRKVAATPVTDSTPSTNAGIEHNMPKINEERGKLEISASDSLAKKGHAHDPKSVPALARQLKSKESRDANKQKRAADQKKLLAPDDIRGEGSSASLVASLKDLVQKKEQL
jgi:hypothetical protein